MTNDKIEEIIDFEGDDHRAAASQIGLDAQEIELIMECLGAMAWHAESAEKAKSIELLLSKMRR